MSFLTSVVFS